MNTPPQPAPTPDIFTSRVHEVICGQIGSYQAEWPESDSIILNIAREADDAIANLAAKLAASVDSHNHAFKAAVHHQKRAEQAEARVTELEMALNQQGQQLDEAQAGQCNAEAALKAAREDAERYCAIYEHYFKTPQPSVDDPHLERCGQCGLNLRNAIHKRAALARTRRDG